MAYLADKASVSIDMSKLTAGSKAKAFWVDPRTGESAVIGSFPSQGQQAFETPAGWEDALLILEPEG
jgi:hypothetical protein